MNSCLFTHLSHEAGAQLIVATQMLIRNSTSPSSGHLAVLWYYDDGDDDRHQCHCDYVRPTIEALKPHSFLAASSSRP